MKISELLEAFSIGTMPEISHETYQEAYQGIISKSKMIANVRKNLVLYCYNNEVYFLIKDSDIVIGNINLKPIEIAGKHYLNVTGIFVDPVYRKTSATYWLIYSVKESVKSSLVADGAIFTDGWKLIEALKKHNVLAVSKLDMITGEISQLNEPINSSTQCYIFNSANIGFGKHMFEGTLLPYTWYPLFEEIE